MQSNDLFLIIWLLVCLVRKKLNPILTELFFWRKETEHLFCFYYKILFSSTKIIKVSSTHHFVMNFPSKQELQQIGLNHLSDIDFGDFTDIYLESKQQKKKNH